MYDVPVPVGKLKKAEREAVMSDCDTCNNLEWDEEDGQYYCIADVDEDDYARMMLEESWRNPAVGCGIPHQCCPYWINGDEYAVVRHQAF